VGKSEFAWHQFDDLVSAEQSLSYMTREYEHGLYSHYTSIPVLENIVGSKSFWLNMVDNLNDKKERDALKNTGPWFSLCFSTGVNENLALWYMYSGMHGKGARISFTKAKIKTMIAKARYTLIEVDGDKVVREICPLTIDEDISLSFRDVLYAKEQKGKVSLKYNTMTNYNIPIEEFEKYKKVHAGFVKSLIWYYEKETRLLIQLKGTAKDQIKGEGKNFRIRLSFEHLKDKDYKITLAPEHPSVLEAIKHHKALKNYYKNSKRVYPSDYSGEIEMNFCKNCPLNKKGEVI